MAAKVDLKVMKCPTCGAPIKVEKVGQPILCVYCENYINPVAEQTPTANTGAVPGAESTRVRIDGIKTPSSALAYLEQFFEDYDWEAFSYAQNMSVPEADKLASSMKLTSADDKNTWILCFKAAYIPFSRKLDGIAGVLESVISEYKKDSLEAYSKFDAYKRISATINSTKEKIINDLTKLVSTAQKYGADDSEVSDMQSDVEVLRKRSSIGVYSDIKLIPEIKSYIEAKNNAIVRRLATEGINAQSEYEKACSLMREKKYVAALDCLKVLEGYSDVDKLREELNRYFIISDVLEIGGKLYYFKKASGYDGALDLHYTQNGSISDKRAIKGIAQVITNYADILYYLGADNRLHMYDFSVNKGKVVFDEPVKKDRIYLYEDAVYLLSSKSDDEGASQLKLTVVDPATATADTLMANIRKVLSFEDGKLVYTINVKGEKGKKKPATKLFDVNTRTVTSLNDSDITVEGYAEGNIIYTVEAPNKNNRHLYIKKLDSDEPERLVEKNIYRFCDIISGKLFYYIGNSSNQTLVNINIDITDRKQWPMFISEVLMEQGGWVYFIRKSGYNSVLCKARPDGSSFRIIASDIESFVELKNGYLYYINWNSELMRVRMDGSNLYRICNGVEEVLCVKEDKIIFVSVDDSITVGEFATATTRTVKSVYMVDFAGKGRMKLAYNVKRAKKYDEDTVYFVAVEKNEENDEIQEHDVLMALDVEANTTAELLTLETKQSNPVSPFVICIAIALFLLFIAIVGFCIQQYGIAMFGFAGALISAVIAVVMKFK
ncbi:MAG: DUF5050 domain-containing protein [Clostridia bacterium]|nr:DUF5050 domain-containing protein [Clostridia bacterium]